MAFVGVGGRGCGVWKRSTRGGQVKRRRLRRTRRSDESPGSRRGDTDTRESTYKKSIYNTVIQCSTM
jgi:hypothetical protein